MPMDYRNEESNSSETADSEERQHFYDCVSEGIIEDMSELESGGGAQTDEQQFYESSPVASIGFESASIASPYHSRATLPASMYKRSNFAAFQFLRHLIGKDLTRVTVPVIFDEPLTFLQRLAEYFEYWDLLIEASRCDDPVKRIEYVTAFAVSASATNYERLNKPFNPLLGETYELKRDDLGFHFVAEQVSHHPPISAFHCEVKGLFKFYGSFEPRMRFWGKHVHASPHGVLTLELNKFGDVYTWENVHMNVHNIIVGKLWVELFGEIKVTNHTNGCRAVVIYKRAKWLGKQKAFVLKGYVENQNVKVRKLYGAWNEALFSVPIESENDVALTTPPPQSADAAADLEGVIECDKHLPRQKLLWRVLPKPPDAHLYYNFSYFAFLLNEMTQVEQSLNLPPTDSRWRPDLRLLEQGKLQEAAAEKHLLEERQRASQRLRLEDGADWVPRWFNREAHPYLDADTWVFNYKYYSRDWSLSPPIFNTHPRHNNNA